MGEFVVQTSTDHTITYIGWFVCLIALGLFALFQENTENDDDDSDSGGGGLMQPVVDGI